ncbi:MAG TPA: hypothetical protein VHZ54_04650 [Solirubrobacterales bacterium]|jgi:hypothetical protein|nr:hypothetical protein [Solirubrobacterales bacterium]
MSPRSQQIIDKALAEARARVQARVAQVYASPPDVTKGRWARELAAELDGARRSRALKAIAGWEEHVTVFLADGIVAATEVGFGDRDSGDLDVPALRSKPRLARRKGPR